MIENIERRTCDKCDKQLEVNKDSYGNNPFACWCSAVDSDNTRYDFCCEQCLIDFFTVKS